MTTAQTALVEFHRYIEEDRVYIEERVSPLDRGDAWAILDAHWAQVVAEYAEQGCTLPDSFLRAEVRADGVASGSVSFFVLLTLPDDSGEAGPWTRETVAGMLRECCERGVPGSFRVLAIEPTIEPSMEAA
jgi:hypothetical protein